jgi:hypothetical protein
MFSYMGQFVYVISMFVSHGKVRETRRFIIMLRKSNHNRNMATCKKMHCLIFTTYTLCSKDISILIAVFVKELAVKTICQHNCRKDNVNDTTWGAMASYNFETITHFHRWRLTFYWTPEVSTFHGFGSATQTFHLEKWHTP